MKPLYISEAVVRYQTEDINPKGLNKFFSETQAELANLPNFPN